MPLRNVMISTKYNKVISLLSHKSRLSRPSLNIRVNLNWYYSYNWLHLYGIIIKTHELLNCQAVQLIQLYKCFCTASCIKASLSSFLYWVRKSFCRLNAPLPATFVLSQLPHTLRKVTSRCREKKILPTPVDELCLCMWLRRGNNVSLYYWSKGQI